MLSAIELSFWKKEKVDRKGGIIWVISTKAPGVSERNHDIDDSSLKMVLVRRVKTILLSICHILENAVEISVLCFY